MAAQIVKKLLTVKRFFQVLPDFLGRLKAASSRALVRVWPCVALVSRLTQVGQKRAGNSHEAGPGRTTLPGFPQPPPATQEHSAPFSRLLIILAGNMVMYANYRRLQTATGDPQQTRSRPSPAFTPGHPRLPLATWDPAPD